MLWKIYTSLISFHMGVNFLVGGMNFWWTFWGSPGIHSHLLGIFFFSDALLKFLQWIIVSEEFKVFTSKKTKQTKQSIRLAGMLLTFDFRNTICFSWIYFWIPFNYILFHFCKQIQMNRRTAITSLQLKNNLCPFKKKRVRIIYKNL